MLHEPVYVVGTESTRTTGKVPPTPHAYIVPADGVKHT